MLRTLFTTVLGFAILQVPTAWAQTTAPSAPAPTPPPAPTGLAAVPGYWWAILAVVVAAGAWYLMRGRGRA